MRLTTPRFGVNVTNMKKRTVARPTGTRTYRMQARADAAEQTGRAILAAAGALWREKALDEVTLQEIAERAGVTVQTVIRRFGSKDGVFEAAIEADASGVEAERDVAPAGDVDGALAVLLDHYERDGDAVLRTLALEGRLAAADAIVGRGRKAHREWCARVFAPWLPARSAAGYAARLDAFVAATDICLWKLFRRDLGRSAGRTRQVIRTLVHGVVAAHQP
jgi:AcrR family transcriptional regulator